MMDLAGVAYQISVWALPVIIAITFHEAAHGWMAERLGDDTARRLGRVTLNPVKHVDPFGTIILPGLLLLLRAPFIFGYAKPVPVAFHRLNNPKRDMIWVALAGPGMNIVLALVSAVGLRYAMHLPDFAVGWGVANLERSILINVVLAVFNMVPIPPLDGGSVLAGVLPYRLAEMLDTVRPYGFLLLYALMLTGILWQVIVPPYTLLLSWLL